MGSKQIENFCFLITDFSEKAQYAIRLINKFGEITSGSTVVIASDDSVKTAQACLSDKIKLYNASMSANKNAKATIKALLKAVKAKILLCFNFDCKAVSFVRCAKLKARFVVLGEKLTLSKREIEAINDETETAWFIVKRIEDEQNLDFYPKYEVHKKALYSQMLPGELCNAIFHRKKRVELGFLAEWGYELPQNPITYNEKLNRFKISGKCRRYRRYTDKYKVRALLKKRGYEWLLPECYAVTNFHITKKVWSSLPESFVIKHSNSSGYNILIKEKHFTDLNAVNRVLKCFKRVKYGLKKNEPVYSLYGRTLCTELLDNITDYKFFCFAGEVKFVAVVREWLKDSPSKEPYQIIFDRDFNELPFSLGYERGLVVYEKPPYYECMLHTVEQLSRNIPHVRLDMMGNESRFYFGEYTFFHGGGKDRFNPPEYDYIVGEYIK